MVCQIIVLNSMMNGNRAKDWKILIVRFHELKEALVNRSGSTWEALNTAEIMIGHIDFSYDFM